MTTIVYHRGMLAADSCRSSGNSIVPGDAEKLIRMRDGSVAAGAGTVSMITRFIAWLDNGKKGDAPVLEDNTVVIHLQVNGLCVEYHDDTPVVTGTYDAWGSGADFAMGVLAYDQRATAEDAVRAACKLDKSTAEPVKSMIVELPVRRPQTRRKR
jgi:ATP-dependent protease HslVU (ClpYQ) peptidase subunit